MFEFVIFEANGLILYPLDAKVSCKNVPVVKEYIQRQILEGRATTETFIKDKVACLINHNTNFNIFFSVTLHQQVAHQISYLGNLLKEIEKKFIMQFQKILERKDIILTPILFNKFTVDDVVNNFRGIVGAQTEKKKLSVGNLDSILDFDPRQEGKRSKSVQNRTNSPKKASRARSRHTDRNDQDVQNESVVVGLNKNNTADKEVEIEQYDIDDFEGVFQSNPEKSAGFFKGILKGIVGEKTLDKKTIQPFLTEFEQHLISKNVASKIAQELTEAVSQKLDGSKCSTFTSIKNIIMGTLREQITRILTSHTNIDVIRDIQTANKNGKPYVVSFIGVNGVGKSTTLAKVAYLFKSHGFKVLIVGCDTYRSGAVKQLAEHADRLKIDLFQRGNDRRDPVPVAKDAIGYAKDKGFDVVLVDTAGRMQNSDALMKQIARLINELKPDLSLFVAEALVGGNGSDQIRSFDNSLKLYAATANPKGIDGIVLTKFDTIDDKVGAALTLVYETGHPIIYLGVGQNYRDLRRMNPEFVVNTLLSGF
jgi:signal recognition particle receptor subunit alpha